MVATLNLTMYRGDSKIIECSLFDFNTVPYNLTDCEIWFTAKRTITESDVQAAIALTSPSGGITIPYPATGQFIIEISPVNTYSLSTGATLLCDIQLRDAADRIFTIGRGTLVVVEDITRTYV